MDILTKLSLSDKHHLNLNDGQLKNVRFIECTDVKNRLSRNGTIVIFDKPIYIQDGVRLSPLYPHLGVSSNGVVYDRKTNIKIPIRPAKDKKDYPDFVNPDRSVVNLRRIKVHRLVGSAWVKNPDHLKLPIINHKDGDKSNFSHDNLEWSNDQLNIQHAFENGLTDLRKCCVVRDQKHRRLTIYSSISKASEKLKISQSNISYHLSKVNGVKSLLHGRYEIKYIDDKTPWLSEDSESIPPRGDYIFTVTYPDGITKNFDRLSDFGLEYLGYGNGLNTEKAIRRAEIKHPHLLFDLKQLKEAKVYQIKNEISGVIEEYTNTKEIASLLQKSESFVKTVWSRKRCVRVGDLIIRIKSDSPWILSPNRFRRSIIDVTRIDSGEVRRFIRLKDAHEWTGCSVRAINHRARCNEDLNGFSFKLVKEIK